MSVATASVIPPRPIAHLVAEIRAQLDLVGLRSYRESLRLVGIKDQIGAIHHAVEGARHAVEFHFAACPSGRDHEVRRELVLTLRSLHDNVEGVMRLLDVRV